MHNDCFETHGVSLPEETRLALAKDILNERFEYEKKVKLERYRRLNTFVRPYQILFVGSSLMEQFPIGELAVSMKLPYAIYNRGIGGFTTGELLNNMEECVYALKPAHIFINIGTNDLNEEGTTEVMLSNYRAILSGIREHLPDVGLNVLAFYPVNPEAAKGNPRMEATLRSRTNDRLRNASAALKKLSEEFGARYLDLNEGITDERGQMKAEYAVDGIHMYGDGYAKILEALLPFLPES